MTSIEGALFFGCTHLARITIPNSVTSIAGSAFSGCSSVTSVTIPNSVTSIGDYAFSNCTGLTSVNISDLTAWCNISFGNESSNPLLFANHLYLNGEEVKNLVIPNSVTSIGDYAFYGCSGLNTITIPYTVTSIGNRAFAKIPNLTDFYCYAENVPTSVYLPFEDSYIEHVILHVPATSIELYNNTKPWSNFGSVVALETPQKCATPTITFANGKLAFDCETEGAELVPSITFAEPNAMENNEVALFSVYRFSVYAKKEGYLDSDVATVNIDLNKLKGDMNNDGIISISDAVVLVDIILGGLSGSTRYYSVGTDAVTADNYTTANNAHQVNSLNAIPDVLLTVSTPGVYYILLPDKFEPEVGGVVFFNVTKLNVNIPGYSVYRTTSLSAGVQIKKVNVGTSGSQIVYE